jgi:small subunit ribosomal protein S1
MPRKKKESENNENIEQNLTVTERTPSVLTIESGGEIDSPGYKEDILWHEVQNAYKTHKILSGTLSGIEKVFEDDNIAVVDYNGLWVIIPSTI